MNESCIRSLMNESFIRSRMNESSTQITNDNNFFLTNNLFYCEVQKENKCS